MNTPAFASQARSMRTMPEARSTSLHRSAWRLFERGSLRRFADDPSVEEEMLDLWRGKGGATLVPVAA
jgi:hypothetical protein